MYDKTDPRAKLATATAAKPTTGLIAEEQLATFYDTAPQIEDDQGKFWFLRGHNFVVAYCELAPGGQLERLGQIDEYALVLPHAGARLEAGHETVRSEGNAIVFMPPGDSRVILPKGGILIGLFTTRSPDLVAACPNADAYDAPRTHVPDFAPWPEPAGGYRIRRYSLDVPPEPGRFGRIFRCSTLMVNVLDPREGPRAPSQMSPHHHDDFEQGSLVLEGAYAHHLRWPWTTDMADWRDDRTIEVTGPSVLVIPPPVLHTSRATGPGLNQMIDIFCPPRHDFSAKPGWVLNEADYPMPG